MFPSDGKVRNSVGLALNIAPATGDIPQVTQNQYIYMFSEHDAMDKIHKFSNNNCDIPLSEPLRTCCI
jgi:hypothetical protein